MNGTIQWLVDDISDAVNVRFSTEETAELADYLELLVTYVGVRTLHDKSTMLGIVDKFLETPGQENDDMPYCYDCKDFSNVDPTITYRLEYDKPLCDACFADRQKSFDDAL